VETFYRDDPDAILVVEWFAKKTEKTPNHVIDTCTKQPAGPMKWRSGQTRRNDEREETQGA